MNKQISDWLVGAIFSLVAVAYAGDECVGLSNILKDAPRKVSFFEMVASAIKTDSEGASCSSLTSVMDKVIHRNRTSGRRLENEKPLNITDAEANLAAALRTPAISARLAKLKQEVPDEKVRLYLEAAILDEEGYYNARELRIQQLMEKIK